MTKQEKIKFILDNPSMSYQELANALGYKSAESVRTFSKRNKLPNKRNNSQALRSGEQLPDMVAKAIAKKKVNIIELSNQFGVSPRMIEEAVQQLIAKNIIVDNFSNDIILANEMKPMDKNLIIPVSIKDEEEFAIGFIADTHIGSKYERQDVLEALYDRFEQNGIKTVFHGGNWIDGEARFNKYDIYVHGVNDQVKNFIEKYPQRHGIKTHIISGDKVIVS